MHELREDGGALGPGQAPQQCHVGGAQRRVAWGQRLRLRSSGVEQMPLQPAAVRVRQWLLFGAGRLAAHVLTRQPPLLLRSLCSRGRDRARGRLALRQPSCQPAAEGSVAHVGKRGEKNLESAYIFRDGIFGNSVFMSSFWSMCEFSKASLRLITYRRILGGELCKLFNRLRMRQQLYNRLLFVFWGNFHLFRIRCRNRLVCRLGHCGHSFCVVFVVA